MDSSYVAVGTAMYMITDGLTSPPKKPPPERRAGAALGAVLLGSHKAPLVPPVIHAVQHERAGRAGCVGQRGRLYRWPAKERSNLYAQFSKIVRRGKMAPASMTAW